MRARRGWPGSLLRAHAHLTACHILLTQVFSANASLKVLHELLKSNVPQVHDKWTLCQHLPPTPPGPCHQWDLSILPPHSCCAFPARVPSCWCWLVREGCSRAGAQLWAQGTSFVSPVLTCLCAAPPSQARWDGWETCCSKAPAQGTPWCFRGEQTEDSPGSVLPAFLQLS